MSRGPFGWCRNQRPADAAKIQRGAAAGRFPWKPGERVDGLPRRRVQKAAKEQTVAENMRAPDGH